MQGLKALFASAASSQATQQSSSIVHSSEEQPGDNVLSVADIALMVEEIGAVEYLEKLMRSDNDEIYSVAAALLEEFFLEEENE